MINGAPTLLLEKALEAVRTPLESPFGCRPLLSTPHLLLLVDMTVVRPANLSILASVSFLLSLSSSFGVVRRRRLSPSVSLSPSLVSLSLVVSCLLGG